MAWGQDHVDEATHESDADWWLSGDGRWHEGTPPPGWTLAADRRWYLDEPPPSARGYAAKWESTAGAPAIVVVPAALGVLDVPDVPDLPDDHDGAGRRRRALATVALVALLVVAGVITAQLWPEGGGDETGPVVGPVSSTSAISTSTTGSPADATPLAPAPTASTTPSTPRASASSVPPTVSTTEEPAPPPSGPPVTPDPGGGPPGQAFVRQGSPCSEVGATGVTANGTPVTCTTTDCDGDTDDQARWWRTTC